MPILHTLAPDTALDPRWPTRLVYRGKSDGLIVEYAVDAHGTGRLTVRHARTAQLRFVHRAQMPHGRHRTGDRTFDDAIVILGGDVDVLRVGATARTRISSWIQREGSWCTDNEAGLLAVPFERVDTVFEAARSLLESLDEPDVVELLQIRLQAPDSLHRAIDQRIEADIMDAENIDHIIEALRAHSPAEKAHWLSRLIPRLTHRGAAVLALLPDPPPAFDALLLNWSKNLPAARHIIDRRLSNPQAAARLLQLAQHNATQLERVCNALPRTPWSTTELEALLPENTAARLVRLDALRVRPAGHPNAYASDLMWPKSTVRDAAEGVVAVHLPQWLSNPETLTATMAIAQRYAPTFIDLAFKERSPALIKALSTQVFTDVEHERHRLQVLAQLPVHGPVTVRHAFRDPALVGAARTLVDAHLEHWLDHAAGAPVLVEAIDSMPELGERILLLCGQKPRPGAAGALRRITPRSESERLRLIKAMGETGDSALEGALLRWMDRGYSVRLACIEALGQLGGRAALDKLQDIASGFLVEKVLKAAALKAAHAIEARLGGGLGGLSLARGDGRLSLDDG